MSSLGDDASDCGASRGTGGPVGEGKWSSHRIVCKFCIALHWQLCVAAASCSPVPTVVRVPPQPLARAQQQLLQPQPSRLCRTCLAT